VVVLNKPELIEGDGFRATLRRSVQSDGFTKIFGQYDWADIYTPDDDIGALVPIGNRRASGKRSIALIDQNGDQHECIAESFSTGHQIFILIHVAKMMTTTRIILSAAE
jgi:hypothetical protein